MTSQREPAVAFVRLSQAEVGEVDAQLRPAVEAIEKVDGYVPAIEQGKTLEEIGERRFARTSPRH